MFCWCYFSSFNVAPLIRQRVNGSQRELLPMKVLLWLRIWRTSVKGRCHGNQFCGAKPVYSSNCVLPATVRLPLVQYKMQSLATIHCSTASVNIQYGIVLWIMAYFDCYANKRMMIMSCQCFVKWRFYMFWKCSVNVQGMLLQFVETFRKFWTNLFPDKRRFSFENAQLCEYL